MTAFFSQHKIIITIIAIVILGVGWYGLFGSSGEAPVLVSGTSAAADPGAEVVRTLAQMHSISLSGTIFSDPAFRQLKDFGTQIVPEPVGRSNPFAPIGGYVPSVSSPASSHDVKLFGPNRP